MCRAPLLSQESGRALSLRPKMRLLLVTFCSINVAALPTSKPQQAKPKKVSVPLLAYTHTDGSSVCPSGCAGGEGSSPAGAVGRADACRGAHDAEHHRRRRRRRRRHPPPPPPAGTCSTTQLDSTLTHVYSTLPPNPTQGARALDDATPPTCWCDGCPPYPESPTTLP